MTPTFAPPILPTGTASLDGVRFHDLRHGYATALLVANVHPKIVSEALGHATVGFTLDTYSHVIPRDPVHAI